MKFLSFAIVLIAVNSIAYAQIDSLENLITEKKGAQKARLLHEKALIRETEGDYAGAIRAAYQAREIYAKKGEPKDVAFMNAEIAEFLRKSSEFEKSIEYFEKALEICREEKDFTGIAYVQNNIGNAYYDKGDRIEALYRYRVSLEFARGKRDTTLMGTACLNIGKCFIDSDELDSAEVYTETAMLWGDELINRKGLHNLGLIKKARLDFEGAEEFYLESYRRELALNDIEGVIFSLKTLGELAIETRQTQKGENYLRQARSLAAESGDSLHFHECGVLLFESGNENGISVAVDYFKRTGNWVRLLPAYHALTAEAIKAGNRDASLCYSDSVKKYSLVLFEQTDSSKARMTARAARAATEIAELERRSERQKARLWNAIIVLTFSLILTGILFWNYVLQIKSRERKKALMQFRGFYENNRALFDLINKEG